MRAIANLLHEPLIKGEKTPSLAVIQDLLAKQESQAKAGEMQLPYSILQVLVSLTQQSESRKNSLGLVDLFQDAHVGVLSRMADLMGYSEAELKTQMTGVAFKAQQSEQRASRQPLSSELIFNHQSKVDFRAFSWELMTRGHSADGMLFAALFLPESERNQLFSA